MFPGPGNSGAPSGIVESGVRAKLLDGAVPGVPAFESQDQRTPDGGHYSKLAKRADLMISTLRKTIASAAVLKTTSRAVLAWRSP